MKKNEKDEQMGKKLTLTDKIYQDIKDDITAKVFQPGEKLNIKEVYGICLAENLASVCVLEKCGFTQIYEGLGNYQGKEAQIVKSVWQI